jgi:phage tail-like protein
MSIWLPPGEYDHPPFANFAFHVSFEPAAAETFAAGDDVKFAPGENVLEELMGAFSDISGLEAMMEHKVIKAGGRNYGAVMRAGPVSFGTVVLKRGVVKHQTLWRWWSLFAGADGKLDGRPTAQNRCNVLIGLIRGFEDDGEPVEPKVRIGWRLKNAMPVKFRVGDLNAKGSDVAVEELHLVHEGLEMSGVVE